MTKRQPRRPLNSAEQKQVAEFIRFFVPYAKNKKNPWCKIAECQITDLMWCWTADGVDEAGLVKLDARKYCIHTQIASKNAKKLTKPCGSTATHEHAVPRILLAKRIIENDPDVPGIVKLLRKFCVAVIVTKDEDKRLRPKAKMPDGWVWENGDPLARYECSGLRSTLCFPEGCSFT